MAVGKLKKLQIFGNDYETKDGTGVRDYIHVVDLADGHVAALQKLKENCGLVIYNLGTGTGYSVLEVVHTFENVIGRKIPYEFTERRQGMLQYVTQIRPRHVPNWAGRQSIHWKTCAGTVGTGRKRTPMDMNNVYVRRMQIWTNQFWQLWQQAWEADIKA